MGRARIGYINKDYTSIREQLLSKIPLLTDRWTDLSDSDLGIVLVDLFCGVADMLAYYIDVQSAEAFLATARERQNIIKLCKLIGYRLHANLSATTTLRFTLAASLNKDLAIPSGLVCRALLPAGQVDFETIEETTIPHGVLSLDIPAIQGIRRTESFVSTGLAFGRFVLNGKAIAHGSTSVTIDGERWTPVEHFQDSQADSKHFLIDLDALDRTTILWGDGNNGAIIAQGKSVIVSYLESLGEQGNIGAHQVTQLITPLYLDGNRVEIRVSNPRPATGGSQPESIEEARKKAPSQLASLWKAVTLKDYQALALAFPGVAKAVVLDANSCQNIRYYQVHLAIAPRGGANPSCVLKRELLAYLEERKVITTEIQLFDPVYQPVPIDAEVYIWLGESPQAVRSRIEQAMTEYFKFDRIQFGQKIHVSDLIYLIDTVPGVSHLTLKTPHRDVELGKGEIPILGNLQLNMRMAH